MKTCIKCSQYKSEKDFKPYVYKYKGQNTPKTTNVCKECLNKQALEVRSPEQKKATNRTYARTFKGRYNKLKEAMKKKSGDISFEAYKEIVGKGKCSYCGGQLNPTSYGLDRVNSKRGYTKRNVVPCCKICNSVKMHHSLKFLKEHLEKMLKGIKTKLK